MFETGKCAQVTREMRKYGISILGLSDGTPVEVDDDHWRSSAILRNE